MSLFQRQQVSKNNNNATAFSNSLTDMITIKQNSSNDRRADDFAHIGDSFNSENGERYNGISNADFAFPPIHDNIHHKENLADRIVELVPEICLPTLQDLHLQHYNIDAWLTVSEFNSFRIPPTGSTAKNVTRGSLQLKVLEMQLPNILGWK
ncbi:hypothetical protein BDB00DRAFT_943881 [Zychaea mexicana]|uniref:uncharacterized protein n=1 Tax=Zychaea mexicana TaxID=64656 RepID=UPI0022FF0ADD|nr:uncharacterized protein BDB00DRAFT_943898 [Zychaea mexicana]XP_052972106.1 uncharacterized protein BDB00DRAFT_943891 [Zychaea mexicana]XP_052972134.1 uncharacterized protein BDB00DRAFT_943881 [Zychaea mexicana]KAI9466503.1 hypothetical protein BDB00DRAFT_943898 [Zychaea mexicana]KAI9466539.1 hypothetical protein BDB00DRAFT_943891 [Zychaea mexicana]KAI9467499.1 hypothetical protein BDB00DRAFT_943881 [Zychaea mexicana]